MAAEHSNDSCFTVDMSDQSQDLEDFLNNDEGSSQESMSVTNTHSVSSPEPRVASHNAATLAAFDPFSPQRQKTTLASQTKSLVDEEDEISVSTTQSVDPGTRDLAQLSAGKGLLVSPKQNARIPGAAGFLEMEEEPPRDLSRPSHPQQPSPYDPIRTSSGLLLTHRKTLPVSQNARNEHSARPSGASPLPDSYRSPPGEDHDNNDKAYRGNGSFRLLPSPGIRRALHREQLEVEHPYSSNPYVTAEAYPHRSLFLAQTQRILSYMRLSVVLSAIVLILGTAVVVAHMRRAESGSFVDEALTSSQQDYQPSQESLQVVSWDENFDPKQAMNALKPELVILKPFPQQQQHYIDQTGYETEPLPLEEQRPPSRGMRHPFRGLRERFETWALDHRKSYHTEIEKQKRFEIWAENHRRTLEKNERHGPCRLTDQPVFGSNRFQDLTDEEFQSSYLTGYSSSNARRLSFSKDSGVLDPSKNVKRHPEVHRRVAMQREETGNMARGSKWQNCEWWNVSCGLRFIFENYFYGFGHTMEPKYDESSYPKAVDWRGIGAVTSVHSQGDCGACWAITAVETVESAVFLATGTLYDLSEAEVTLCQENCDMCYGGWPQDAFDYIMDHDGLPLESDLSYNGSLLLKLSQAKVGESDEMNDSSVESYMNDWCPANGSNTLKRYGQIEGYGYATSRCVCYTDGSGCDCDSQDEGMAVRNLATYGPAVVCVDASTWKDYSGGIITSESGCSQKFLDVNHCVQAVGYAYTTSGGGSESENGSHDSGSQDDSGSRQGYWIVRNQWSSYWGMSGYAWVAMGENTCGILNDFVQAYA